jgi:hypothetical protein
MQPIVPETFDHGFQTTYEQFEADYQSFVNGNGHFPDWLRGAPCHLDPDFRFLSYGDGGQRAGRIRHFFEGSEDNFIAFYASFRQVDNNQPYLVYAIIGFYRFQQVQMAHQVPIDRRHQNAHTRLAGYQQSEDIVIFANTRTSGRLRSLIPIGEWRNRAYRVRQELLNEWGGISSRDGYIQRSVYLPHFCEPEIFLHWFNDRHVELIAQDNIVYP